MHQQLRCTLLQEGNYPPAEVQVATWGFPWEKWGVTGKQGPCCVNHCSLCCITGHLFNTQPSWITCWKNWMLSKGLHLKHLVCLQLLTVTSRFFHRDTERVRFARELIGEAHVEELPVSVCLCLALLGILLLKDSWMSAWSSSHVIPRLSHTFPSTSCGWSGQVWWPTLILLVITDMAWKHWA